MCFRKGRQSDKFGRMAQWWTGETLAQYLAKAQCFIDQYANYSTPDGQNVSIPFRLFTFPLIDNLTYTLSDSSSKQALWHVYV